MTAVAWALIDDVLKVTGKTVTQAVVDMATIDIETHTGLIQSVERVFLTRRDLYWLKLAVCYQAAWAPSQPDRLELKDVSTASQDGQAATFKADAHTLSPNARNAIKHLSFKGSRTISPRGGAMSGRPRNANPYAGNTQPLPEYIGVNPMTDGSDDYEGPWQSL